MIATKKYQTDLIQREDENPNNKDNSNRKIDKSFAHSVPLKIKLGANPNAPKLNNLKIKNEYIIPELKPLFKDQSKFEEHLISKTGNYLKDKQKIINGLFSISQTYHGKSFKTK